MDKTEWAVALKAFAEIQRQHNPVPGLDSLSEEEKWHYRIIGGEFIGWYQRDLHDILVQRNSLRIMEFDSDPLLIFTTTMPGLIAAQQIMQKPLENFICLLHTEFEEWERKHPVDSFTFHIHHWSYFGRMDEELLPRARETYPEVNLDQFRLHICGDLWGEHCGSFREHLWQWDGHEMKLLKEGFYHGVY